MTMEAETPPQADGAVAESPPQGQPEMWEDAGPDTPPGGGLIVALDGYEGPLDLLLALARTQKVDLAKISILALVEQYLAFLAQAKSLKLEIAADYLVMAAWLAFLKSRLLVPKPEEEAEEGPTGEELAARLAFQLRRLEAMREAGARLLARPRTGRDIFARGAPEPIRLHRTTRYGDTLHDLLKAYSVQRQAGIKVEYKPTKPPVIVIEEARRRIEARLGSIPDWTALDALLVGWLPVEAGPQAQRLRRSSLASTFTAVLELAKEGHVELHQERHFAPVFLRARKDVAPMPANDDISSGNNQ